MKYLSVCSGIEAATVAWHHLGWTPAAFSEIEPFPSAVLKHHYPNVVNHGDMNNFTEWPNESIDLLAGGTPCQSFSVAGLRKGLADPRGNLMLVYLGIADRFRPRWLVWENVPGVLSSGGGRDFGTFLGSLVELGYGFAYRVLDAQWFGVAQRRKRVFVVGCLGDATSAAKVLFERESVCRNPAPSREKGKEIAGTIAARFGSSRNNSEELTVSKALLSRNGAGGFDLESQTPVVADCLRSGGAGGVPSSRGEHLVVGSLDTECGGGKLTHQTVANGHIIGTITARMFSSLGARDVEEGALLPVSIAFEPGIAGREGNESRFTHEVTGTLRKAMGDNQTAVAFSIDSYESNSMKSPNPNSGFREVEVSKTLDTSRGLDPGCNQGGMAVAFHPTQDPISSENISHALGTGSKSGNATAAVAFESNRRDGARVYGDTTNTLQAFAGTGGGNSPMVQHSTAVRRLTPTECERLQGFPDSYTAIPWKKKTADQCPDGPRYKALGNSMAVPVMRWIGERIDKVNKEIQS
jgi:DNA (cytosine-5)-methyltransferase 1